MDHEEGVSRKMVWVKSRQCRRCDGTIAGKSFVLAGLVAVLGIIDVAAAQTEGVEAGPVVLLQETFEGTPVDGDPADWLDTASRNRMSADDNLFKAVSVDGGNALSTCSKASDIHSHYAGSGSEAWFDYTYTGRVMLESTKGSIGITFLSDYPHTDSYYRLRSLSGGTFHISPHPWRESEITGGTSDSGVKPVANTWYRFRIVVEDDGAQTIIRAKIWFDGEVEPASWQIDCYDSSATRRTLGTVGVWSAGRGCKYWDDLEVVSGGVDDGEGTQEPATDPPPPDPEPTDPPPPDPAPTDPPDPDPEPTDPPPVAPEPTDPPPSGDSPWWEVSAEGPWPGDAQEFTGQMGSFGFDIYQDQEKPWWFHDVEMNGDGADSTLYAVGTDCRVERATIYGGKHGIRMASVNGLLLSDSTIKSDPSNLGKSLKICGSYGRGPASRYVTVQDCDITGIVAIQPLNEDPLASGELIEYVVLRNCVIKPYGNTAVEIAAKHIWLENCTFDFRETNTPYGRGVSVRTYNTIVPEDVTVRNCELLLRSDQYGELVTSEIPINP